jgi:hypothetical protein
MGKTQVAVEFILPMPAFWDTVANSKTSESDPSLKKLHALNEDGIKPCLFTLPDCAGIHSPKGGMTGTDRCESVRLL